jgi:D-serine deaminase-like pyridoxal phosphate-dependent protein
LFQKDKGFREFVHLLGIVRAKTRAFFHFLPSRPMNLDSPTAFVDLDRMLANIRRMKGRASGLCFRPHFKTHQSAYLGERFREEGVDRITVGSLRMAEYFLQHGWTDQTVAMPLDPLELELADRCARTARMHFTISEGSPVQRIEEGLSTEAGIFIEIDTGDHRTGFDPEKLDRLDPVVERLEKSEKLRFEGFLTHSGHSYDARGKEAVEAIHRNSMASLKELKERYRRNDPVLSVGDTPTASLVEDMEGVDELRPGNFVFYDLMMEKIGACDMDDIAYALICPVIAKHEDRSELLVHGGAVHFSKDRTEMEDGRSCFGIPVQMDKSGLGEPYDGSYVRRLSQEMGVVVCSDELFRSKEVGDTLAILPVHSCLSADAMDEYLLSSGERVESFPG